MVKTESRKAAAAKIYLTATLLLTAVSFLYFKSLGGSFITDFSLLAILFGSNAALILFLDSKAQETGNFFLWGVALKGVKTFFLFLTVVGLCLTKVIQHVNEFAIFFTLGFIALMVLEVIHIYKEFGKGNNE